MLRMFVSPSLARVGAPLAVREFSTAGVAPVYVVFGATGGIGSQLCSLLSLQPGAKVVAAGRDEAKLQALVGSLTGDVSTFVVDVLAPDQVNACIADATKRFGRVDGVANCVGSVVLKSAHTTTEKEFEETVRLNLFSCFHVLKPSVKAMMKTGGGSIAFCTSAVARHGIPNHEAIAAAKGGVAGLALSAAATYAPKNIRVNCVAPGLTRTPMTARITGSEAALRASEAMHALKRIAEPEEVARGLEFLLQPANSFVTGQVLGVDGGLGSVKAM